MTRNENIFLHGIRLQGYRAFGTVQEFAPFQRFNFFIGANNSGKSAVLSAITDLLPVPPLAGTAGVTQIQLGPFDSHTGGSVEVQVSMGLRPSDMAADVLRGVQGHRKNTSCCGYVERILAPMSENGLVWFTASPPYQAPSRGYDVEAAASLLNNREWNELWNVFNNDSWPGGDVNRPYSDDTSVVAGRPLLCIKEVDQRSSDCLQFIKSHIEPHLPDICLIPAIRQIGPSNEAFDHSGKGLIDRLAKIQNPGHENYERDRQQFAAINQFVAEVTGIPNAKIEIPHDRAHILFHTDSKRLPLASLGTGIHEVIILAALCTLNDETIVCIEEPEIHLHPTLQRKLIRYLSEYTNNQYFITTHSASFIDTPEAAIFHVSNDGVSSSVKHCTLNKDKFEICHELGYKASDILQSNAVVWVEGPSDRIYIKHWVSSIASELVEGLHYSIMFYGGRLLSHLSADDDEIAEFISLRSLNRHVALVMDSDKDGPDAAINDTKQRLVKEFDENGGFVWLTDGREIENYIEPDILQASIKDLYPKAYAAPAATEGFFNHALYFRRYVNGTEGDTELFKGADKIKVARKVCEKSNQPGNRLNLREKINGLIEMIRRANGTGAT